MSFATNPPSRLRDTREGPPLLLGDELVVGRLWDTGSPVPPRPRSKVKLWIRLISGGQWNDHPQKTSIDGFTVWRTGAGHDLVPVPAGSVAEAVKLSLKPD